MKRLLALLLIFVVIPAPAAVVGGRDTTKSLQDHLSENTITSGLQTFPYTLATWFYQPDTTVTQRLVNITKNTGTTIADGAFMQITTAGAAQCGSARRATSLADFATSSNTVTTNRWQSVVCRYPSGTSRTVHLNGTATTDTGTNVTPSDTPDWLLIGALWWANTVYYETDATIAWVAMWSGDIGAEAAAAYASGVNPCNIRVDILECVIPMHGSGDEDCICGAWDETFTESGTFDQVGNGPPVMGR